MFDFFSQALAVELKIKILRLEFFLGLLCADGQGLLLGWHREDGVGFEPIDVLMNKGFWIGALEGDEHLFVAHGGHRVLLCNRAGRVARTDHDGVVLQGARAIEAVKQDAHLFEL